MTTIKLRRGLAQRWIEVNPVLDDGEPGFETNTKRLKIGDGRTPWADLDYALPEQADAMLALAEHEDSLTPHPVYDNNASLTILYENAKV